MLVRMFVFLTLLSVGIALPVTAQEAQEKQPTTKRIKWHNSAVDGFTQAIESKKPFVIVFLSNPASTGGRLGVGTVLGDWFRRKRLELGGKRFDGCPLGDFDCRDLTCKFRSHRMIDLKNNRAYTIDSTSSDERIANLEQIVLDLMMEIEALRACMIGVSSNSARAEASVDVLTPAPGGVDGEHTPYGEAYLKTAWLTHWAAGPTNGFDKLLDLFYLPSRHREQLMLERLGYSQEQIQQFIESAFAAETCT